MPSTRINWERSAFLRKGSEEGADHLFSLVSSDKICGNSSKLHQGKFRQYLFSKRCLNIEIGFLERWPMPQASECLKGILTMSLITGFNLVSAELFRQLD